MMTVEAGVSDASNFSEPPYAMVGGDGGEAVGPMPLSASILPKTLPTLLPIKKSSPILNSPATIGSTAIVNTPGVAGNKRGRGRPRKTPNPIESKGSSIIIQDASNVILKKRLGRPPKKHRRPEYRRKSTRPVKRRTLKVDFTDTSQNSTTSAKKPELAASASPGVQKNTLAESNMNLDELRKVAEMLKSSLHVITASQQSATAASPSSKMDTEYTRKLELLDKRRQIETVRYETARKVREARLLDLEILRERRVLVELKARRRCESFSLPGHSSSTLK